ncbi:MAG TPA: CDP-glycerol glycerophosphotransferase family protein [Croceibacterium sp.]|jgi:CDP-glycerol glycerophosphotransferase|nr:CDP-glycerol glycerophosphotransferase family protein [Croceibacterium sp.]
MRPLRVARIAALALADCFVPKRRDLWVFPTYFIGPATFRDNARAVFEDVAADPAIRKVVFTRGLPVLVEGTNVEIVPMGSWKAAWRLMRAGTVFVQHSLWLDYAKSKLQIAFRCGRRIVNLWHGIPIKDISHGNTGIHSRRGLREMGWYALPCSSEADRAHMQRAFHRTPTANFWVTGLPRDDVLLATNLPADQQADLESLRRIKAGRRLVLYAPTYRETQAGATYYEFGDGEIAALQALCREHDAVFGVRYHSYRRPPGYRRLMEHGGALDLSAEAFGDMRVLARETDVMVTDYSSVFLDALYLGRRCLCFAYDRGHYEATQRGLFYPLEDLFGSDLTEDFAGLLRRLEQALSGDAASGEAMHARYATLQPLFFAHRDGRNAERLVARLRGSQGTAGP